MRSVRLFLCAVFFLFSSVSVFCQIDSVEVVQQVVVPKEIYVGDSAEVRLTFHTPVDYFALLPANQVRGNSVRLDTTLDAFTQKEKVCTVESAVLERNDFSYTIVLTLVPWEPGVIDFAPFDLNAACNFNSDEHINYVDFLPVTVSSLSQKMNVSVIRGAVSPQNLPETNYILWAIIVAGIVLVILLVLLLVHLSDFIDSVGGIKSRLGFIRNALRTKHKIKKLLTKKIPDSLCAEQWQHIMRSYLQYRFASQFMSIPSNRIYSVIEQAVGGSLVQQQETSVAELSSLFVRTDYIRYALGSADAALLPVEEHCAVFLPDEKKQIVAQTLSLIDFFEKRNSKKEDAV
ncbi:MAG TPA: hypothetical protein DC014_00795 [Treponema sp.]|nr:hypothetical protein [Treponema sp.]